jgi:uncharacterized repeat protein (TIGR04002 family)
MYIIIIVYFNPSGGKIMNKKRQNERLYTLVISSVFTAIITIMTFYIKVPSHNGYIHLGDSVIYLAACLLPTPYAVVCAGIGGMLADTLGGFIVYIIPTLIIKALLSLVFSSKTEKILTKRNLTALIPASIITIIGYYIAEAVIISISSATDIEALLKGFLSPVPWSAALYCIPGNITQAVGSAIVFILIAIALDKIRIKDKI